MTYSVSVLRDYSYSSSLKSPHALLSICEDKAVHTNVFRLRIINDNSVNGPNLFQRKKSGREFGLGVVESTIHRDFHVTQTCYMCYS